MKIALIQSRIYGDRPADNLEGLKATLKRKELKGAELVVLPALALSGRLGPMALRRPGLAIQHDKILGDFLEISAQYPEMVLATSAFDFQFGQPMERPLAVRGGRTMDLEQSAGGQAKFYLAGQTVSLGRKAVDDLAAEGGDIWISFQNHPFNGSPYYPPLLAPAPAWRINISAVGGEGPGIFEGATWVVDPEGQLKGWAHGFENAVIILDTRSTSLPTLEPWPKRDQLATLREALTVGLRDYLRSANGDKVLVGLSGGLDSAVVALLAADALGSEKVLGVAMPSQYNAPESLNLARDLARNLKIDFLTVPIDGVRKSFSQAFLLTPKREEKDGHLADENVQARIRSVILMYLANREGRLLLATGNKSEAAMGYSTLYGDTCGAVAPIGDVYKSRLYELAEHLNMDGERIPRGIITRAPTAELRPDQKDEDSLPPYQVLDDILFRHLEGGRSGSQVAREGGHSPMTVAWVLSTLKKTAFKRAQEPFSLMASTCPLFGLDWPV